MRFASPAPSSEPAGSGSVGSFGLAILRFVVASGLVAFAWPWLGPGYLTLVRVGCLVILRLLGFDAAPGPVAETLQFELVQSGARGLVTPMNDAGPLVLNVATLAGLFAPAFLPPRRHRLLSFLLAGALLLLFQSILGTVLVLDSLPTYSANAGLGILRDLFLASRVFVPVLLWLLCDAAARVRFHLLLDRLAAAAVRRPAAAGPEP